MRRRLSLLAVAALAVGWVLSRGPAAPAQADPGDGDAAALFATLQAAGITYEHPDEVVRAAKVVCTLIGDGSAPPAILTALRQSNPGLTEEHAAQFIGIAVQSYCPDRLVAHPDG